MERREAEESTTGNRSGGLVGKKERKTEIGNSRKAPQKNLTCGFVGASWKKSPELQGEGAGTKGGNRKQKNLGVGEKPQKGRSVQKEKQHKRKKKGYKIQARQTPGGHFEVNSLPALVSRELREEGSLAGRGSAGKKKKEKQLRGGRKREGKEGPHVT